MGRNNRRNRRQPPSPAQVPQQGQSVYPLGSGESSPEIVERSFEDNGVQGVIHSKFPELPKKNKTPDQWYKQLNPEKCWALISFMKENALPVRHNYVAAKKLLSTRYFSDYIALTEPEIQGVLTKDKTGSTGAILEPSNSHISVLTYAMEAGYIDSFCMGVLPYIKDMTPIWVKDNLYTFYRLFSTCPDAFIGLMLENIFANGQKLKLSDLVTSELKIPEGLSHKHITFARFASLMARVEKDVPQYAGPHDWLLIPLDDMLPVYITLATPEAMDEIIEALYQTEKELGPTEAAKLIPLAIAGGKFMDLFRIPVIGGQWQSSNIPGLPFPAANKKGMAEAAFRSIQSIPVDVWQHYTDQAEAILSLALGAEIVPPARATMSQGLIRASYAKREPSQT